MDILEKLFDSASKARLLKFFFRNPKAYFGVKEIAARIHCKDALIRQEVENLKEINLLKRKKTGKGYSYSLNREFAFFNDLGNLVLKSSPTSKQRLLNQSKNVGRIKLLVIAGKFIHSENSRVDLFIVGDDISEKKTNNFIGDVEADVGSSLDFVVMDTDEFRYRQSMFDRFIRDVLEKPHEKLINKLGI